MLCLSRIPPPAMASLRHSPICTWVFFLTLTCLATILPAPDTKQTAIASYTSVTLEATPSNLPIYSRRTDFLLLKKCTQCIHRPMVSPSNRVPTAMKTRRRKRRKRPRQIAVQVTPTTHNCYPCLQKTITRHLTYQLLSQNMHQIPLTWYLPFPQNMKVIVTSHTTITKIRDTFIANAHIYKTQLRTPHVTSDFTSHASPSQARHNQISNIEHTKQKHCSSY